MILQYLRQTKPWVRLMSVMSFLGSVLCFIVALFAFLGGAFFQGLAGNDAIPVALLGVVYVLFGFLIIAPAIYLWRYASSIGALLTSQRVRDLETALGHQKSYWRFTGIMVTVILVIYGLALVFGIGAAILASVAS